MSKNKLQNLPHNKKNMQAHANRQAVNMAQDPTKLIDQMLRTFLEDTPVSGQFTDEEIDHMRKVAELVMPNAGVYALQCDNANYKSLLDFLMGGQNANLYDFSALINGYDRSSPKELGLTPVGYYEMLERNKAVADKWNAIVLPAKTDIMKQVREANENRIEIIPATSGLRSSTSIVLPGQTN